MYPIFAIALLYWFENSEPIRSNEVYMNPMTIFVMFASGTSCRFLSIEIHDILFCILCNRISIFLFAIPFIYAIIVFFSYTPRDIYKLLFICEM